MNLDKVVMIRTSSLRDLRRREPSGSMNYLTWLKRTSRLAMRLIRCVPASWIWSIHLRHLTYGTYHVLASRITKATKRAPWYKRHTAGIMWYFCATTSSATSHQRLDRSLVSLMVTCIKSSAVKSNERCLVHVNALSSSTSKSSSWDSNLHVTTTGTAMINKYRSGSSSMPKWSHMTTIRLLQNFISRCSCRPCHVSTSFWRAVLRNGASGLMASARPSERLSWLRKRQSGSRIWLLRRRGR